MAERTWFTVTEGGKRHIKNRRGISQRGISFPDVTYAYCPQVAGPWDTHPSTDEPPEKQQCKQCVKNWRKVQERTDG